MDIHVKPKKEHSGIDTNNPEKYFHESRFHPHYDGRFATHPLLYDDRPPHLTALIQTYLATMSSIGAETWLMHGSLLGWWWNKRIMPWDTDLDLMISERTIHYLAAYYNMSMHHFDIYGVPPPKAKIKSKGAAEKGRVRIGKEKIDPTLAVPRDYLLEINPHYSNDSQDTYNHIDARWVDTTTGLFIDITTLRHNITAESLGMKNRMMCKDGHKYWYDEIYPLRDSMFEGANVKIPHAYSSLLAEEYGPGALTDTNYENHVFNQEKMIWEPLKAGKRPKVMTALDDHTSAFFLRWKLLFDW
ncbi:MAG: hypothetical protein M1822_006666 [Bathelium mastoideum]|nr:MAG: hypothetical protein M1822_006666 [Bathelium mastoideum]